MILAAGRGERIQPLSDFVPKPLLSCAGMTLIERLIHSFREAGVSEFTVGVGWRGDLVRQHLAALPESRLIHVVEVPDYQRGPLQTLVSALSTVDDRTFLVCPADYVVAPEMIPSLTSEHSHGSGPRVMTMLVDPKKQGGTPVFGRADGLVAGIGDSATSFEKIGCSAMLLAAGQDFKADCRSALESGATQVVSVINSMVSDGKPVRYVMVRQQWFDVDDIRSFLNVNHHLLKQMASGSPGTLFVPLGQEVDYSGGRQSSVGFDFGVKVIGPTLICQSSHLGSGSKVGPFVTIGRSSHIGEGTSVVESVLFDGSDLPTKAKIRNSAVHGRTVYRSRTKHVTE